MMDLKLAMSIITLNLNVLDTPFKSQRLEDWIKKK